jgi:hypothetical protein
MMAFQMHNATVSQAIRSFAEDTVNANEAYQTKFLHSLLK